MSETGNRIPFENLSETRAEGGSFDLKELEKNPTLVVKQYKYPIGTKGVTQVSETIQKSINFLKQTPAADYLPANQVVRGETNDGDATFFIVAEKISGENLSKSYTGSNTEKEELTNIANALTDLYLETYNGDFGEILEFEIPQNYMKGTNLHHDQGERIYMIDLFPSFPDTPLQLLERVHRFSTQFQIRHSQLSPIIQKIKQLKH